MAERQKKAKLAHEKGKASKKAAGLGSFQIHKVIECVTLEEGKKGAVVDLTGKNDLAIVDSYFVHTDADGILKPTPLACPATYDVVKREAAFAAYKTWQAGQGSAS